MSLTYGRTSNRFASMPGLSGRTHIHSGVVLLTLAMVRDVMRETGRRNAVVARNGAQSRIIDRRERGGQ